MKQLPMRHTRRGLAAAGAIVVGCRDMLRTSPAAPHLTPPTARTTVDPAGASPDLVIIELPAPDIYNGPAIVSGDFANYLYPTIVKASVTGTETYTPNVAGIGDAQGPFGPYGRVSVRAAAAYLLRIVSP